jgi:hypothetical protein
MSLLVIIRINSSRRTSQCAVQIEPVEMALLRPRITGAGRLG